MICRKEICAADAPEHDKMLSELFSHGIPFFENLNDAEESDETRFQ